MNTKLKKNLEAVINSLVNEDTKGATKAFHDYLQAKTQTILTTEHFLDDEENEPEDFDQNEEDQYDSYDEDDDLDKDDEDDEDDDLDKDDEDDEDDEDFYQKHPGSRPDSQEITDRYNAPGYVGH